MRIFFILLLLCIPIVAGIYYESEIPVTDDANVTASINLEKCNINIKSSHKKQVVWDISDSDADQVDTHCDFYEKKVFGGSID